MLNKLDERHPLGGPVWFNWSKLMLGLLSPILLAVFWGGWGIVQTHLEVWHAIPVQVEKNTIAVNELSPKIDRVIELLEQHLKGEYTMTGQAIISPAPTSPRPAYREGVWINELSPAICYKDLDKVKITAVRDGRRTAVLRILGTISTPDADLLLEITYGASRDFHVPPELNMISIILEPVKPSS